jgi:hypothetical protein
MEQPAIAPLYTPPQEVPVAYVVVTDIDIKFMSLVWLMVKASIAAIPAALVLALLWSLVIGGLLGALLHH